MQRCAVGRQGNGGAVILLEITGAGEPGAGRPDGSLGFLPRVTDFGLAKLLDREPGLSAANFRTQSGAILGTPSYMAPEQALGKGQDVGPATDVYALGALLYELLTERPPFRGETALDTLEQVRSQETVPPSQLRPRVPHDLETICLRCLEKDPGKRYATAEALAEDLRRFLAGEPIRARRIGLLERLWRWCRRNPALAALLACVTASLLVIALSTSLLSLRLRKERDTARANWERAEQAEASLRAQRNEAFTLLGRARDAEQAARRAHQEALDKFWDASLARARLGHRSGQVGRRFRSLEAVGEAAAIRPSLELRNEAIACMALVDLRLVREWRPSATVRAVTS